MKFIFKNFRLRGYLNQFDQSPKKEYRHK